MSFVEQYLEQTRAIAEQLNVGDIERLAERIAGVRDGGGRIFFVGVGGGAAHASHAVNDFRKLAEIECYAPTDNVSELTARINDEGWDGAYAAWLKGSKLGKRDAVFVFSVGGGSEEAALSVNLVNAIRHAKSVGAGVFGVVGRDGGYTRQVGDAVVVIPTVNAETVTPHTEGFQAVVWHLLVSHPKVARRTATWESKSDASASRKNRA